MTVYDEDGMHRIREDRVTGFGRRLYGVRIWCVCVQDGPWAGRALVARRQRGGARCAVCKAEL